MSNVLYPHQITIPVYQDGNTKISIFLLAPSAVYRGQAHLIIEFERHGLIISRSEQLHEHFEIENPYEEFIPSSDEEEEE